MADPAWLDWTVSRALPLWTERGFNGKLGLFEEQLEFDGTPVDAVPLRLMVQCRQIAVLCLAQQRGWLSNGIAQAVATAEQIERHYFQADGSPGWVFSIDRTGRPVGHDRDLYTHAFVLFAFAWLVRAAPTSHIKELIARTIAFLDEHLADREYGGYWNVAGRSDESRRQDPHMHIFEALLELYAAIGDPEYLSRATTLKTLALAHFFDGSTGTLHEAFDRQWRVTAGTERVEPGHNFEWAWLLRRFEALAEQAAEPAADTLLTTALRHGIDRKTGRVIDEMMPDGTPLKPSSRLWPHAEALRGLTGASAIADDRRSALATKIIRRLLERYCLPSLQGGWIDRLDENDRAVSTTMPASTLYHLVFALDATL